MSYNNSQEELKENRFEALGNSKRNRLLQRILSYWYLFVLFGFIGVVAARVYLHYSTPIYTNTAKVLIKEDDNKSAATNGISLLSDVFNTTSTVDNEAEILKTSHLMQQVVEDLNANITYYYEGRVHLAEIFSAPFEVKLLDKPDNINSGNFDLNFSDNNNLVVTGESYKMSVRFGKPVSLPGIGKLVFIRKNNIPYKSGKYSVTISDIESTVSAFVRRLAVVVANKQTSVITLTFNYPDKARGIEILSTLLKEYQLENLNDKSRIADSTINFIEGRLLFVSSELGNIEGSIQNFKQKSKLTDIAAQSKVLLDNASDYYNQLQKTEIQISILKQLESYLKDDESNRRVFPSSLIEDPEFNSLIGKYNNLVLDREHQLISSTEDSPFIQNIDKQLSGLRKDMLSSLNNNLKSLYITRSSLQSRVGAMNSEALIVPKKERTFLDLSRQQQIKQDLYVYLMQKREETAISKKSTISNARIIEPPRAGQFPISPNGRVATLFGLMVGLILPALVIYILFLLDNKVSSKDDVLEHTSVPILGEIFNSSTPSNVVLNLKSKSPSAEQIRALRTNLSFVLPKSDLGKVILVTSSMSAEGKSFTTINLGSALAMSGKRVLLMELDLRRPTLSSKLGMVTDRGFTNFIIDTDLSSKDIINTTNIDENLFIISAGFLPPNPSETLLNSRTETLFNELRKQFDYILVDTPPIGLVTDAQILGPFADLVLYIVRHGYTYKGQLNIANELFVSKKMSNMGIVINDIKMAAYSMYEYSYSYGYSYGYGYNSYLNDDRPSLPARFFKWFKK